MCSRAHWFAAILLTRPFIKLSWEIEDNKSRHVDFQTVKGSRNR